MSIQSTNKIVPTRLGVIDRVLAAFSPSLARRRLVDRVMYNSSVNLLSDQGYITKDSGRRSMRGWNASANSADIDILPKSYSLRASCRDLDMNAGLAIAVVERLSTNSLGVGLRLKCQIDRDHLGFTGEDGKKRAKVWEETTQREWNAWSNSIFSDAELTHNVNENATLAFVNMLISGDCFVALPGVPLPGQIYDLKVKVIEADYVDNPNGLMSTQRIAGGVELNALGAPIAYYFRKPDPNASVDFGPLTYTNYERVSRFNDINLQQILHLFKKRRPHQRRGVPILAPFIEDVKQITRYKSAEVDAAILNSFFTVFIKSIDNIAGNQLMGGYIPPDLGTQTIGPVPGVQVSDPSDARDDKVYEIGRANVIEMDKNQDISLADPKHPVAGFGAFLEAIAQEIGAGVGVPYEVLMQRFSSSFSASKAALQEAWKLFLTYRKFLVDHYYMPIYEMWMFEAVAKGRISAPGFFEDPTIRASWLKSAWIGSGQGMIDPMKETNAAEKRIKNRISTREREYEQLVGGDWYGAMNNFAKEVDHLDDLKINPEPQNVAVPAGTSANNNQNLPAKTE